MKLFFYTSILFVLFLALAQNTTAQTVDELLIEGDKLVKEFDNKAALEKYLQAEKTAPENWEVLWRISRAYVDIAEHMPEATDAEKDEQLKLYEKSLDYAEKAVKFGPDKSVNYLRRAISNGRIALFKGVFSVSGVVNKVKEDCEKAIKLGNGGNEIQGLAHYVLARTHAKTSEKWAPARAVIGLGWADIDIALKEYKTAAQLYPDFIMIYLDYAKALIREDEYKQAREMLNKALKSPLKDEDDKDRITEAKKLLEEIKNE